MSSTFTPAAVVDMSKEKDWPANLGMLDWDSTSIIFTKRSLIEFLKYTGTTVDTNFGNIQKLPRYAQFGKLSDSSSPTTEPPATDVTSEISDPTTEFKPSRRVRAPPGGSHSLIFSDIDDDALATAPPKFGEEQTTVDDAAVHTAPALPVEDEGSGIKFTSSVKPSRRVRTNPGGDSSLANFWDADESQTQFKPSRRVRQGPGGQDHINGIF